MASGEFSTCGQGHAMCRFCIDVSGERSSCKRCTFSCCSFWKLLLLNLCISSFAKVFQVGGDRSSCRRKEQEREHST